MAVNGELGGIGLADLFHNVAGNRASGVLRVTGARGGRWGVAFAAGKVVGCAGGDSPDLPVVERLVAWGCVDAAAAQRHLGRRRRARRSDLELLVEAGLAAADDVGAAVAGLVEEVVCDLLELRQGRFEFTEGDPAQAGDFDAGVLAFCPALDVEGLLMEAARRSDESARIRRVVRSGDDVFVAAVDWDEVPAEELDALDDDTWQVADAIDGERSVVRLARDLGRSTFAVGRALATLVEAGLVRATGVDELLDALDAADDPATAERLVRRALELEPGRDELRLRLVELLAEAGRGAEAAAERALLGHTAAARDDLDAAVDHYRAAVELSPEDPSLRERLLHLVARAGSDDELAGELVDLVALYDAAGTFERARDLLAALLADEPGRAGGRARRLAQREDVVAVQARVAEGLGDRAGAARLWRRLGETTVRRDEARGLYFLRRALEHDPDDAGLQSRVHDLTSGRQRRRRQRRQRLVAGATGVALLTALGLVGVAELSAARRVARALETAVGADAEGGGLEALVEVRDVGAGLGWTAAGRRASDVVERLVEVQLRALRRAIAAGDYDAALARCALLDQRIDRADLRATVDVLRERAELEREAAAIVDRLDRPGVRPETGDLELVAALTGGVHLEFHLTRIGTVRDHEVRCAMLDALLEIDSPRALAPAARLYVRVRDAGSRRRLADLLATAARHRAAGREANWSAVYPELEALVDDGDRGAAARTALQLLRGEP